MLRTDPGRIASSMRQRGADIDLDALIGLDREHRRLVTVVDNLRADLNRAQKQIGKLPPEQRAGAIADNKQKGADLRALEADLGRAAEELDAALRLVPNLVHPDSPPGREDAELRRVGSPRQMDFAPADHLTLGEGLGIIDVKRAAKVSGSRFAILRGKGALLELALVRFVLDRLMAEGFVPVIPPVLVREEAMYGTGFFPTDEAQVYKTADDDLYLAGTSEVPIAGMHADEIFAAKELPVRYAGISTCFRREAGTYGKDTRGIIRVHQFDKVEMFSFCHPEESDEEHGRLLAQEEGFFQALEIPYRVLDIAAGELAAPNYRKFDIEAWLPGGDRWLEVTSCSNDWDFQARRLGVRMKAESGTELVHTLNGTAVAVGRAIVALLENHQQADGSVTIPEALRPYTGFEIIAPPG
ncbi:MAG TPA: serine--tRNA ligase [Actinomycetota bacterium]|nr:serine--tRNA ligase [Actinomycetota bacterium]